MGPELSRVLSGLSSSRGCCSQRLGQNVQSEQAQMRKRLDFFHFSNNGMQVQCMVHQHGVQQVNNYLSSGF